MSVDEGKLADLRRDIAEAHAIATRTHSVVSTLAATLKDVVLRQDRYERRLNLNSFVAYLIFTVLLGGGFTMLYRSRAEHLLGERDAALKARAEAREEAAAARKQLEAREAGGKKADELWALLSEGRRAEVIARIPELAGLRVSNLERQALEQGVARARAEIVDASFAAAVEAEKIGQWKKAVPELRRALAFEPEGPRAVQMRYHYGVALLKQGDFQEAARELDVAVAGGAEKTAGADARFQLAAALEGAKQPERARVEYLKFADVHGESPLAGAARRRAFELKTAAATPAPKTP